MGRVLTRNELLKRNEPKFYSREEYRSDWIELLAEHTLISEDVANAFIEEHQLVYEAWGLMPPKEFLECILVTFIAQSIGRKHGLEKDALPHNTDKFLIEELKFTSVEDYAARNSISIRTVRTRIKRLELIVITFGKKIVRIPSKEICDKLEQAILELYPESLRVYEERQSKKQAEKEEENNRKKDESNKERR
jgi:hypothetical protein